MTPDPTLRYNLPIMNLPTNVRLIARLDIKAPNLIKGVHLEGLRVVGDPYEFAMRYYEAGADELIYMDIVASLYERNSLTDLIKRTAHDIFIPITVGGGIRKLDDVTEVLRAGADKVAINTAAVRRPELIREVANRFGSQCMVLSIEAKRIPGNQGAAQGAGKWHAFTDNGREHTGFDVVEWAKRGEALGAGEILLTSVDQEGTRRGFDLDLIRQVSTAVKIPVIASGGMGKLEDLRAAVTDARADAVAMADVIHYQRLSFPQIREFCSGQGVPVRKHEVAAT